MEEKTRLDRAELLRAYADFAISEDGKLIIADLERQFNHDDVFDQDPLEMAGRARERAVVKYIHKRIKKGSEL